MKLLNQSIKFLVIPMMIVIGLWALIFYFTIYSEIKTSVDEGLDNYKRQIVYQVQSDSTILDNQDFDDSFFAIRQISSDAAQYQKDSYKDTVMYMQDSNDPYPEPEPMRMLTTAFETDGNYYELKVVYSMIEEDDLAEHILWNILTLFVLLFLTMILINNITLKQLWNPFYALLSQLKSYNLDKNKDPISIKTKTKEFNDLEIAVNTLLKRNTELFDQQKQFIGNASHELQTPLAIVINKLELLVEKGNLNDEQAQSISDTIRIVEQLVRTNKSLLLLSKIENRQFPNSAYVLLNDIIKQILSDFEDLAEFRDISVSFTERDRVTIETDPALADILVSNLIRNAIFHNHPSGGSITIELSKDRFTVCNSSNNEPLDEKLIFTRFYKSDNTHGSGLGLSVVKAICDLHGFAITYKYQQNRHCFEINLKK